jgi:hypothetical protein
MKRGSAAYLIVALVPFLLGLGGCASITGSPAQSVSVQTRDAVGQEVAGAACELSNNKGRWYLTTPGSTTIVRSNDDMQVLCSKSGYEPGRASVVSATKAAMFGNIILGGGIGAFVDHTSGAAYEYPSFLQLLMGGTMRIEPPSSDSARTDSARTDSPSAQSPGGPRDRRASARAPQGDGSVTNRFGPRPASVTDAPPGVQDQLQELERLHQSGLITTYDFLDRRKKLLGYK